MAPKGLYSYRVVTQLDPIDFLFFTALVYEIGSDLERYRVPATERVVHSFRFNPLANGRIFDPDYNYESFKSRCREIASNGSVDYVVVGDIADFYPRVYLHRIESALELGTRQVDKSRAIVKLFKGWHDRISYGIPVGSAASRLLAEVTLNDVDQCLLSEDATFCRYSDDFRIFCHSKSDAYSKLETLASVLFENHGLFLQPGKTEIIDVGSFDRKYLQSPFSLELASLRERFGDIVESLELEDPYGEVDYDELDDETREAIDSLNLQGLLEEQLARPTVDTGMFKFILRRLGQLNQPAGVVQVFENLEKCYHLVPEFVSYVKTLDDLEDEQVDDMSNRLFEALSTSMVVQIPFNRCWFLSLLAEGHARSGGRELARLFRNFSDPLSHREVILSLGRAHQHYWFRNKKSDAMNLSPWAKRAFLAAASCMAPDEVRNWHGSIRSRLDELEKCVIDWVASCPF